MTTQPTQQRNPAGRFQPGAAPGPGRGHKAEDGPTWPRAEQLAAELVEAVIPFSVSITAAESSATGLRLDGAAWRRCLFLAYRHGWRPAGARKLERPMPEMIDGKLTQLEARTRHGLLSGAPVETVPGYLAPPLTLTAEDAAALAEALAQAGDADVAARQLAAQLRLGECDVF